MSPRLLTIAKAVIGRRPLVREPDTTVPETGAVAMARALLAFDRLLAAWREDAGRRRAAGDEAGARAIEACLARLEGM